MTEHQTEQPRFNLMDGDEYLSAAQAEASLCHIHLDPEQARRYLDELGKVDQGLVILALMVNPELRDQLWPSLSDEVKFFYVIYDRPVTDRAALVKRVVHDVVSALYHVPGGVTND